MSGRSYKKKGEKKYGFDRAQKAPGGLVAFRNLRKRYSNREKVRKGYRRFSFINEDRLLGEGVQGEKKKEHLLDPVLQGDEKRKKS